MDKLGTWLGFIKFLLGTVALGLVTTFVNKDIQDKEVALKEIEQKRAIELREQEQLGKFIEHALAEDVGIRLRFSQYFSTVTRSPDLRTRWIEYNNEVEKEFKNIQSARDELIQKTKDQELTSSELNEAREKIEELEQQLSAKPATSKITQSYSALKLTENFSLGEFTSSQTAERSSITNIPNGKVISNLYKLSENILEPVRTQFQSRVLINSGYRSPELNQRIGGSTQSQHTTGHAVDIQIAGYSNREVACWIKDNLDFDFLELAYYREEKGDGAWVGVSFVEGANRKKSITSHRGQRPTLSIECSKS